MGLVEEVVDVPLWLVGQTRLRRFERNVTEFSDGVVGRLFYSDDKNKEQEQGSYSNS